MRPWRRLLTATPIAAAVTAFVLLWRAIPGASIPIHRLDFTLYDSLYQFRPIESQLDREVVIVAVDQLALDRIDSAPEYQRGWPWPRKYWGSLAADLSEDCHPKPAWFVVLFSQPLG